jgi:hypothetical protein
MCSGRQRVLHSRRWSRCARCAGEEICPHPSHNNLMGLLISESECSAERNGVQIVRETEILNKNFESPVFRRASALLTESQQIRAQGLRRDWRIRG